MKKFILLVAVSVFMFSCKTDTKKAQPLEESTEIETVETPVLTLGEFDAKAGDFLSKEIKVQGIVDHICKHGGKKILLVTDEGDAHVFSEERFNEDLMGSEITVTGVVLEERIDEAYLLKMEEDNIKSHSEGESNDELFNSKKKHIKQYRDQMKADKKDHISNYSLQYVSHEIVE